MARRGIKVVLLIVSILAVVVIVAAIAVIMLFRPAKEPEVLAAATPVGVPVGPASTKIIGTTGGSIASSDGRVTVTVPPNDVPDPVDFSITPITNQNEAGIGNAYRLEPDGQKFAMPVQISFKYNEQELEDTIPGALIATYQEKTGGWNSFTKEQVDEAEGSVTISTTHFTDVTLGKKFVFLPPGDAKHRVDPIADMVSKHFRLSPEKATLHPGESLPIDFVGCESDPMGWLRPWIPKGSNGCFLNGVGQVWNTFYVKQGKGTILPQFGEHVLYTAPNKKPTPNVVRIECGVQYNFGDKNKFPYFNDVSSTWHYDPFIEPAEITIVDWGYWVSGNAGPDTVFSGVVCDIEKPFTIQTSNPFLGAVRLDPASSTAGTWSFSTKNGVYGGGSGQYTVEGIERDTKITNSPKNNESPLPKIIMTGNSTGCVWGSCGSGSGTVQLILTRLTSGEGGCG